MPAPDGPLGGQGGGLSRSDMTLIRRAAAGDWDVPPATRARLLKRLAQVVDAGFRSDDGVPVVEPGDADERPAVEPPTARDVIAAARTIIAAHVAGQRLEIDRTRLRLERARLKLQRLAQLGSPSNPIDVTPGGVSPEAAERALRALNDGPPAAQ